MTKNAARKHAIREQAQATGTKYTTALRAADTPEPIPPLTQTGPDELAPIERYMRSDHAEVIAAHAVAEAAGTEFLEKVQRMREQIGADAARVITFFGVTMVRRFDWSDDTQRPKRWRNNGTPYKNNPLHADFEDLKYSRSSCYPGYPETVTLPGPGFTVAGRTPVFFEHDGVVYAHIGDLGGKQPMAGGMVNKRVWSECPASVFHAAHEAHVQDASA